ncbi:hypothetical protein DL239_11990 [Sedimentitalea sp. CY04]|uniref:Uncharacterized protein n=1 Tax=Parasedimentitalea denitrificans TaxID=2211118 RepID=A0ABX0W9W3_9RHOB|nr:hypothetical protein [Sedimentitalea sp. CY04]
MGVPWASALPGRDLIDPFNQGELDGLCGLYAIINAIRLAYAPSQKLETSEAGHMFAEGVGFLSHRGWLGSSVKNGMSKKRQSELAEMLAVCANRDLGRPVSRRPLSVPLGKQTGVIWNEIVKGRPVCALFGGALDHYTVISSVSETGFQFFDSAGLSWVRSSSCEFSGGRKKARHRISRRSLFSIAVQGEY